MAENRTIPTIPPVIGITCDADEHQARLRRTYIDAVASAGGAPVLLPPPRGLDEAALAAVASAHAEMCDAIVFSGGDDADLAAFGKANHPASKLMDADRQRYERALLAALDARRAKPALGICLGMQQMALHAGGDIDPHLPDTIASAAEHKDDHHHEVRPSFAHGVVSAGRGASNHHQGVRDAGKLRIVATAHDGQIEAVDDPSRPFYLGVQWHPERTTDPALGSRIFEALVAAARGELTQRR